jgi:hypothetical protein
MQSVSQYDTGVTNLESPAAQARFNRDFHTFTPTNPASAYLEHYHVRFGPAENPEVSVREDGLFTVRYAHLAAELWIDSPAGWLAVVDGASQYAMVERFHYDETRPYPGKASVIFWTNGPSLVLNDDGQPAISADPDSSPYYLEAELNSPMCRLRPQESCDFETDWFPTRSSSEFHGVSDAGVLTKPLRASALAGGKIKLAGTFGVFFSGHLVAHFYSEHGHAANPIPVVDVDPTKPAVVDTELSPGENPSRVSLHLVDDNGVDRGALQEVRITREAQ